MEDNTQSDLMLLVDEAHQRPAFFGCRMSAAVGMRLVDK